MAKATSKDRWLVKTAATSRRPDGKASRQQNIDAVRNFGFGTGSMKKERR